MYCIETSTILRIIEWLGKNSLRHCLNNTKRVGFASRTFFKSVIGDHRRKTWMTDVSTPTLTLMFQISEELANIARRDVRKRYMACWPVSCQSLHRKHYNQLQNTL